jgi:hypothetical protein
MSQTVVTFAAAEAIDSERDLLRGDTNPLRTATGFVLGTALCGAFWSVAGLLVWSFT